MSPQKLISLTTLVALGAVVGFAASMFGEGRQSPLPELPPQEVAVQPPVAEPVRVVATDVAPKATRSARTVRDYLQEYYGAEWEGKRLVLEKTQASLLDQLLDDQVPILPWEDVAEQVRSEFLMTPAAMESQAQEFMMWDPDTDLSWEHVRKIYPYVPEAVGEQHLLEFRAIAKQ